MQPSRPFKPSTVYQELPCSVIQPGWPAGKARRAGGGAVNETRPLSAGTTHTRRAVRLPRARGAGAPSAMAAPHGTAAVGAGGDDKKKAFETAKQVSCVRLRNAPFPGSKHLSGSCRRWNTAWSCLGSA